MQMASTPGLSSTFCIQRHHNLIELLFENYDINEGFLSLLLACLPFFFFS